MGVLVNPAILRQYAETVDATASSIKNTTIPDRMKELSGLLPGSRTAFMASGGMSEIQLVAKKVAVQYEAMAGAVRNAAGEYEATDEELSAALDKIEPKS